MSELSHISYPDQGEEDTYCQICRRFATSQTSQEEWERFTRHLEMTDRRQEFIVNEFNRLLKDWYRPTEGLALAEVQVHGGDARLVIGKLLEEFRLMQAQYKLLASQHPLLVKDSSSKPVPGYDPGHTLGTSDQEPHSKPVVKASWNCYQAALKDKMKTKSSLYITFFEHLKAEQGKTVSSIWDMEVRAPKKRK
ncbi:hypothetical protein DSO57_1001317 [Entomophthora muscae]|uniref:Uncharacterized protein n=1 Tax=Entomophthora muscae TaxID=34485 RepID=A0ACC2U7F5_9FUNG|nr:hypothetical protein DSO57_1001317 [Entomophthora muscae]